MMRKLFSIALVAGSLATAACGGTAATSESKEQSAEKQAERVPFLDVALNAESVALRPEQRQELEALRATLVTKNEAVREEAKVLANLLADALEKGTLDRAAADAQVAKIGDASAAARPDVQAAMAKVHALLDPAQREAVVAAMRAHKGKHFGGGRGHFFAVFKQLDLTSEQRDALEAAWRKDHGDHGNKAHKANKAAFRAALDSFATPAFDAKALPAHEGPVAFAARGVAFVEAALPILDANQRQKLAAAIRAKFA